MSKTTGTRIVIRGRTVGMPDRHGEIIEARGTGGTAPYLVRFDDGRESIVFPGDDFEVAPGASNKSNAG